MLKFAGGIALIAGAFVLPLMVPLVVIMLTALLKVHLQYGFSPVTLRAVTASGANFGPIGYEMKLLYIAGLLTLGLARLSAFSVDAWLENRKQPMHPATDDTQE